MLTICIPSSRYPHDTSNPCLIIRLFQCDVDNLCLIMRLFQCDVDNAYLIIRLVRLGIDLCQTDVLYHVHALGDPAKHSVLLIQPGLQDENMSSNQNWILALVHSACGGSYWGSFIGSFTQMPGTFQLSKCHTLPDAPESQTNFVLYIVPYSPWVPPW